VGARLFVDAALNAHWRYMDGVCSSPYGLLRVVRVASAPESNLPRIQLRSAGADIHAGGHFCAAERARAYRIAGNSILSLATS